MCCDCWKESDPPQVDDIVQAGRANRRVYLGLAKNARWIPVCPPHRSLMEDGESICKYNESTPGVFEN